MTPAEVTIYLPSHKDSIGSARMLGSWVPSGRCFLRHVAFVSTEASSCSLGAQDGAHTLHIKHALFSPTSGTLRHVSSWS